LDTYAALEWEASNLPGLSAYVAALEKPKLVASPH